MKGLAFYVMRDRVKVHLEYIIAAASIATFLMAVALNMLR